MRRLKEIFRLSTVKAKVAKNTAFQLFGKVLSMSVTVLMTVLVTRVYGREGYGEFSLMQSVPALFFIIVDFGLNAISVREVADAPSKIFHYFFNVLIFRVLLSLVFMGILAVFLPFFPYSSNLILGIRLSLLLILTQGLYATTNIVFQSRLRYDLSTLGYSAGYAFILSLGLWLVSVSAPIHWVNFTYVLGGFVTFALNYLLISRMDISHDFSLDVSLIKRLFCASLPLGIMFVFSQMNFKEDAVLLSILPLPAWLPLNHTEVVGVYSLPYKVFEVSLVFPTFFMNAVYPLLVKHSKEGPQKLWESFRKVLFFLLGFGLVTGLLGFTFAPLAIRFLGGAEFSRSIEVLRILMGGVFIFYLTQPVSWLLVTLGQQKYLPYVYFVSVVFNLTFNLLFIPRFSFYAAALITVVSEGVILLLLAFFARKSWRNVYAD